MTTTAAATTARAARVYSSLPFTARVGNTVQFFGSREAATDWANLTWRARADARLAFWVGATISVAS